MKDQIRTILLDTAEAIALSLASDGSNWVKNDQIPDDLKLEFLKNVLNLLEENEKYEFCAIVNRYKLELENKMIEHE